jgi:hypothetical protein
VERDSIYNRTSKLTGVFDSWSCAEAYHPDLERAQ